ncbi:MAG: dockerin type I domain-containing protein [Oscillospiraceae bacterium]|nr:dockerin type I domain-containing protein [Oscillospiraceae bacterium]
MKRITALFLVLCLFTGFTMSNGQLRGDADGDGKITTNDALAVLRHITGEELLKGDALKAADFNGDGVVDTADALTILKYIVGLDDGYGGRLLYFTDFENGLDGWAVHSPKNGDTGYVEYEANVELTKEESHSGKQSLKVSDRKNYWQGTVIDITDYLRDDVLEYEVMVWVKVPEGANPTIIRLSYQIVEIIDGIESNLYGTWDDYDYENDKLSKYRLPASLYDPESEDWAVRYHEDYFSDDGWVLLHGEMWFFAPFYKKVYVHFDTSHNFDNIYDDYYIDDFVLLRGDIIENLSIERGGSDTE